MTEIKHAIQFLSNDHHFSSKGAVSEAIEIAKKLKSLKREKPEHPETAYILAYTLKTTYSPARMRQRERFIDHFEVFCEYDEMERTPKEQADQKLGELKQQYNDEGSTIELYCWNIAKITKTSEHYKTEK